MSELKAHLFVCTNSRSEGDSCGSKNASALRVAVKEKTSQLLATDAKNVRINAAGCLGRCSEGIVAVCYPSGRWLTKLNANDVDACVELVQQEVDQS
jgi:(2Fe-2S) ferredoxin